MKFDYQESLRSMPQPLTQQRWTELTTSELVNRAVWDFQHGDAKAKKRLPAVMWQASFNGKARKNENAIPSGLYMLDLDHLEGNTAQIASTFMSKVNECGIMLIHTTPSGHGLRVVARMMAAQGFSTIGEYQLWLAAQLGFKPEQVDTATHDLARMSFVPPENYVHFMDGQIFTMEPECTINPQNNGAPSPVVVKSTADTADVTPPASADGTLQTHYQGIPLTDIAKRLIENLFDTEICEGNRNSSLYKLARVFRYVCDFNPQVMAAAIPHYGLADSEVMEICRNTINTFRRTDMPPELREVIAELREEQEDAESVNEDTGEQKKLSLSLSDYQKNLPPLPPLFREFVKVCPPDFKAVQIVSMLPVVGTLCTHIRSTYLDGNEQSPSFITVVTAPQASGKSFARNMYNTLTARIQEQDATNRAIEESYRQELKKAKNAKEQPEDPRACIRLLPPSVSIAKLLQRLDYARQKHLLTFAEEIDTLTKSNRSGAWAQKSDIYRNAFDNAEYGQDYMSDASYSTIVRVYYNLLILGTPRAVNRFFNDIEDGLVSRVLFAELPSQAGKRMPKFGRFSANAAKRVDAIVERLMQMQDCYELEYLNKAIDNWLEQRRIDFLRTQNMALEIFRRRAAVIGFRAGLVAVACYEAGIVDDDTHKSRYDQRVKKFALWVANYALTVLLNRFGEKMEEVQRETTPRQCTAYADLYAAMAVTFTSDDLRMATKRYGSQSPTKQILYRWRQNDMIENVEGVNGVYKKITDKKEK